MKYPVKGNIVSIGKWKLGQPNGGNVQQCVTFGSGGDAFYFDDPCDLKVCFACKMLPKKFYTIRGNIPQGLDRDYFVSMNGKETEISGTKATKCYFNETWNFGLDLKQDEATSNLPPAGLQDWNNGLKLKFSQCKSDEFTCHAYGHCLTLMKRCDGIKDCIDGSDEKDCKVMTLEDSYDKKYPSAPNTLVGIYIKLFDIIDIKELEMKYTAHLKVESRWYDSRIKFRNLKLDRSNLLVKNEIDQIWTPQLLFLGSNGIGFVEAGQNTVGQSEKFIATGYVGIERKGIPRSNDLKEIDEDQIFEGIENPLLMKNYITANLDCTFDLRMYPFDSQVCFIELIKPGIYESQFFMHWEKIKMSQIEMVQYDVEDKLQYNNDSTTQNKLQVKIYLKRKLANHVFSTYIPTICLAIISGITLIIDSSHFEATIAVALTCMLVVYVFLEGVSAKLPQTSYLKMIDIWLFGSLVLPFLIIIILVVVDYLTMKENNEIKPCGNMVETKIGKIRASKWFMALMQILLASTTLILCIIYWAIGLSHYYNYN